MEILLSVLILHPNQSPMKLAYGLLTYLNRTR